MPPTTRLVREGTGEAVTLTGSPFPPGGEGRVFEVAGSDLLAKVYHDPTPQRAEKLLAMIKNPPRTRGRGRARFFIAWPVDRLLEPGSGRCVGFLMPRAEDQKLLLKLYNPRARGQPVERSVLVRTARSIAAAVRSLHEKGYVVGDVNESNILAGGDGSVSLVDADSFQVRAAGRAYRCLVGRPEFTPPELQGASFADVDRGPEHDRFGLGVLAFLLLMEGNHPFAAEYTGRGNRLPLPGRIARGLWPYGAGASAAYRPRKEAPPLDALPPAVQALMRRCFEAGHNDPRRRPTAAEWEAALAAADGSWVGRLLKRLARWACAIALALSLLFWLRTPGPTPPGSQPPGPETPGEAGTDPARREPGPVPGKPPPPPIPGQARREGAGGGVGGGPGGDAGGNGGPGRAQDPRLAHARRVKEHVERRERALALLQAELVHGIECLASGPLAQERLAWGGLRGLVAQHRALAKGVVEGHGRYVGAARALKGAMEEAAPRFREAGEVFARYAAEEPSEGPRRDYLALAGSWREVAGSLERRAVELGAEPTEAARVLEQVERAAVFLERYEGHLESHPHSDTAAERQRYLGQMRGHLRGFEELWRLVRKSHTNLKSQALDPELRQHPVAPVGPYAGAIQASLGGGFSLRQRLPLERPVGGQVGVVEVVSSRGDLLVVRVVAGGPLLAGDFVTAPRRANRPQAEAGRAGAKGAAPSGGKHGRVK